MRKQESSALYHCQHSFLRSKRGIGIMEVVVAALVLGILYTALSNLQKSNHESLLRIRGRDGATEVAQGILDSLGALGLANFKDEVLPKDDNGNIKPLVTQVTRTWDRPGIGPDMKVRYLCSLWVELDSFYQAETSSWIKNDPVVLGADPLSHVYAKRINVKVSWPIGSEWPAGPKPIHSINITGVIR